MPESTLRAVIFDMDGVIVDSASDHFRSWQEVFQKRGFIFAFNDFMEHFGHRDDVVIRAVMRDKASPEEIKRVTQEKEALYRRLAESDIEAFPGFMELIKSIKDNGFKTAIASSTTIENVRFVLQNLGVEDCFDAVAHGAEVAESKPSPQIFLLAAEKIGVPPARCIVIEDAIDGVIAAKKGGMKAVAVTNTHPMEKFKQADLIVDSLEELKIAMLNRLLAAKK